MMFRYSEADVRKVKCVQFGILGPEELKTASVKEITTDRTFENGRPVPGGLMDPALGAIDRTLPCSSCGMDEQECPGHFGHLCLCKPMYHVSFINTTLKLLRCVCFSCSEILGDEPLVDGKATLDSSRLAAATSRRKPVQRLRAVMDFAKTKPKCWSCSAPQPNFKRDGLMINAEFKEATDVRRARALFEQKPSSLLVWCGGAAAATAATAAAAATAGSGGGAAAAVQRRRCSGSGGGDVAAARVGGRA
jgi:DNA-directed RNA polymerase II subunit RPB1